MGRFYDTATAGPADERHRQVRDALSATTPAARALPVWDQSRLAGIAAYSFVWSAADLARWLYLKELHIAAGPCKPPILAAPERERATGSPGWRYCPRRSSTGSRTAAAACRCPADPVPRPALACRTPAALLTEREVRRFRGPSRIRRCSAAPPPPSRSGRRSTACHQRKKMLSSGTGRLSGCL